MLPEALLVEAEEAVKLRMTSPCLAVLPGKVAPIIAALARTPACCLREKAIIVWLTKINRWWHLTVEHSVILPPRPTRTTLARILMSNRYNRLPLLLAFEEAVLDWSWTQVPPTFPENAILGVGYRSQSITELHDSLSPF
jgi:hypothetical protein